MTSNFGDFQIGVYLDAVKGVNSRYPFDFLSIERKASEALPDWVYRYVSAAAGDGRPHSAGAEPVRGEADAAVTPATGDMSRRVSSPGDSRRRSPEGPWFMRY